MKLRSVIVVLFAVSLCGCVPQKGPSFHPTIPIISWGGVPADKADTLFSLGKDCGFDIHLGLYRAQESALLAMDAAARAGMGIIINFPQIKDSTEKTVPLIRNHPALVAYHIKDEPDTSDFAWLKELSDKINALDPNHPCYINLFPNWAWGPEEYAANIEAYADMMDVPFYSFDNYPITESEGAVSVRSDWYRNLEEFSAMARRHGKPFWAFALATSHSIPEPPAFYPVPTLGQIRLQVFSNLLYGAQAIQYFTYAGVVDAATCTRKPEFDIIRQVNLEIKAYSPVFLNCKVQNVWHAGEQIPAYTKPLDTMPHSKVKSLKISGVGAVVSLIENEGKTYLAVQNCDCLDSAVLDIEFSARVKRFTVTGEECFDGRPVTLEPGDVAVFRL